jgi:hypothetical protein
MTRPGYLGDLDRAANIRNVDPSTRSRGDNLEALHPVSHVYEHFDPVAFHRRNPITERSLIAGPGRPRAQWQTTAQRQSVSFSPRSFAENRLIVRCPPSWSL